MRSVRSRPTLLLLLGLMTIAAAAPGTVAVGEEPEGFFDGERFRLEERSDAHHLVSADGLDVVVPREWLFPAEAVAAEEETYVTSLAWDETVTSFPIGGERVGLHLSSYAIAEGGSAAAAAGRDLYLLLDPASGALFRGLDLGESKGRVRVGGCFAAWFRRVFVGDVDCDRRLDLAVVEERISCVPVEEPMVGAEPEQLVTLERPVLARSALQWHRAEGEAWVRAERLDGRLPCMGLLELPLQGIVKSPVDFVLEGYRRDPMARP
ncbi:MAG: hypothetical protein R2991_07310 [Thermoanaerobaculia bacterium]